MMRWRHAFAALVVVLACPALSASEREQSQPPAAASDAVEELLAADRAFARAAEKTALVAGISAMFADDVMMPVPGGSFARGRAAATAALESNPDNTGARAQWSPIRGGISADGRHGFTFGYMKVRRADGKEIPVKYVAYWIKQPAGWRVAVYKRARGGDGAVSQEMMPPSLPERAVPVSTDAAAIKRHRDSLAAAERAFSDEAQKIGLAAAFTKYGTRDSVNVGAPTDAAFVRGSEAIGRSVSGGSTSTDPGLSWAPDSVIVASSGDLGVTMGLITIRGNGEDGKPRAPVPFITIWRRATPGDPWRYIAE